MTKMVLFASLLLVGVLRFNYKKRGNLKTVSPFQKSLRTLLVGSHQQKDYTLMSQLQNPRNNTSLPCGDSLLKKGVTKKQKIEGKICLEKELLRRLEKKTVLQYNKNLSRNIFFNKNQDKKFQKTKIKTK
jgi:hypothetical protein